MKYYNYLKKFKKREKKKKGIRWASPSMVHPISF